MSSKIRLLAGAVALAASSMLASEASAQQAGPPVAQPDSVSAQPTHQLPAIVSRANNENLFSRIWNMRERRHEVLRLMHENKLLEAELRRYDKQIARLEVHLDSLRAIEAEKQRQIAQLDSATAATRAQRLALEERVRALEATVAKKGGR